jgi:hypothetical protein
MDGICSARVMGIKNNYLKKLQIIYVAGILGQEFEGTSPKS